MQHYQVLNSPKRPGSVQLDPKQASLTSQDNWALLCYCAQMKGALPEAWIGRGLMLGFLNMESFKPAASNCGDTQRTFKYSTSAWPPALLISCQLKEKGSLYAGMGGQRQHRKCCQPLEPNSLTTSPIVWVLITQSCVIHIWQK